jgi:hypothetical protein
MSRRSFDEALCEGDKETAQTSCEYTNGCHGSKPMHMTHVPVTISCSQSPQQQQQQPTAAAPPPSNTEQVGFCPSKLSSKLSITRHNVYVRACTIGANNRNLCFSLISFPGRPHALPRLNCNSAPISRTRQAKHATDGQLRGGYHIGGSLTYGVSICLPGDPTADAPATLGSPPP